MSASANQGSDSLTVLGDGGAVLATVALPYGSRPYGIAFAPDGSAGFVTLEGPGRVARIYSRSRAITGTLALGPDGNGQTRAVRGLAIAADSRRVFVSRFVSPQPTAAFPHGNGELYEVDASTLTLVRTMPLADSVLPDTPDQARGIPNYLSSVLISPDGSKAWLPSKQDNMSRGLFRDGNSLTHDDSVRPIVSSVDLAANAEDVRLDLNDSSMPFAAEASAFGDLLFIAVQGNNRVDVRNAYTGRAVGSFSVGRAPEGLVLDGAGVLYVQNFLSRTLSIVDVNPILQGLDSTANTLATVTLTNSEPLSADELLGKRIFYNAADRRMANEGYLSCATCHLDGDADGRVWDFTDHGEGLRNTIPMLGRRGTGHGKVHWTANFDELQDFENDMREHFGGEGFMTPEQFNGGTRAQPLGDRKAGVSHELDALAAYAATLDSFPRSPFRNADGSLTPGGSAGKAVFQSLDCAQLPRSCDHDRHHTPRRRHDHRRLGQGHRQAARGRRHRDPDLARRVGDRAVLPQRHCHDAVGRDQRPDARQRQLAAAGGQGPVGRVPEATSTTTIEGAMKRHFWLLLALSACSAMNDQETADEAGTDVAASASALMSRTLPSPAGTGALSPWGGTDAAKWRPEAIIANASSALLNEGFALADVVDARAVVAIKMKSFGFEEFGDGQVEAGPRSRLDRVDAALCCSARDVLQRTRASPLALHRRGGWQRRRRRAHDARWQREARDAARRSQRPLARRRLGRARRARLALDLRQNRGARAALCTSRVVSARVSHPTRTSPELDATMPPTCAGLPTATTSSTTRTSACRIRATSRRCSAACNTTPSAWTTRSRPTPICTVCSSTRTASASSRPSAKALASRRRPRPSSCSTCASMRATSRPRLRLRTAACRAAPAGTRWTTSRLRRWSMTSKTNRFPWVSLGRPCRRRTFRLAAGLRLVRGGDDAPAHAGRSVHHAAQWDRARRAGRRRAALELSPRLRQ